MKRKYSYFDGKKQTEREYSYIPVRYILAVLITLFEVLAVIGTRKILLGTSGGAISVFIIAMAIYMIVRSNKKLKLLKTVKE